MYKSEPLQCWQKAKELRLKYYRDYAEAHQKGGLRWAGGAWAFDAVPAGLGEDVYPLTSEPYGASIANDPAFSLKCMEAIESKGYARDLCSYLRCYLGSMLVGQYAFGGPFPKADFLWQNHICCTHAKWYQLIAEMEGIPFYGIDISVGPYAEVDDHKIRYIVSQVLDGIQWLEKTTGRKFDDERFIQAVQNECKAMAIWAEICALNKAIPAPVDEKSLYALYVFNTLQRSKKEFADFMIEVRDEVKDRVERGIAAIPTERARIIFDSQPPWSMLKVFRYLEGYGCVSVGSFYTYGLEAVWDQAPDGTLGPAQTPMEKGTEMKDREQAARAMVEWNLRRPTWWACYRPDEKSQFMVDMCRQWHCLGAILHLNRGCEGTGLSVLENRLALLAAGFRVMTFEGNMADVREVDEAATLARVDAFMESLGLRPLGH